MTPTWRKERVAPQARGRHGARVRKCEPREVGLPRRLLAEIAAAIRGDSFKALRGARSDEPVERAEREQNERYRRLTRLSCSAFVVVIGGYACLLQADRSEYRRRRRYFA